MGSSTRVSVQGKCGHGIFLDPKAVGIGAIEAEAKAFEMGLQFAKDVGVRDLILEGDSLNVYRALGLTSPPPSVDVVIIGVQKACSEFCYVGVSHVRC